LIPVGEPVAVTPVGQEGVLVSGTGDSPWWNDTVFYEVFVRSFYDSDGDGVGDLSGLIEKLDYLNDGDPTTSDDLGVTGIWLMPVAQSPSYHGYDVVDYYQVDEEYGTREDFLRLVEEAHRRGIRVIVDLVLNHTSAQHPWFQEALDPASERRDWYVWAEAPPEGPLARYWHESPEGDGSYYYAFFWDQMPDLNYENPAVTQEMEAVARFWLEEMGVDGFRLDAIKYLVEEISDDGQRVMIEHAPRTHAWLQGFHELYSGVNPEALAVGEVWADTETASTYLGDEVDLVFEFTLANAMLDAAVGGSARDLVNVQERVIAAYPPNQFATFLANHDQNRTRSRLLNDAQAKVAATLQFAFGGVPFIYYGEEIGMQGEKPDENIRRPMQWTADGGFSTAEPWNAYYEDVAERNVEAQEGDAGSLLNHYRALVRLRSDHEALRVGDWWPVDSGHRSLVAFLRSTPGEAILLLANLSSQSIEEYGLELESGPLADVSGIAWLLGEGELAAPAITAAGGFAGYQPLPVVPPNSAFLIQLLP
jgi:glycosidase